MSAPGKNDPGNQKQGAGGDQTSYKQAASEFYNRQYENWVPWVEDQYLKYFTKDNKASYSVKQQLDQTKITGNPTVDSVQDSANNLVSGQLGQGGVGEAAGDKMSDQITASEQGKSGEKEVDHLGLGGAGEAVKGAGSAVGDGVGRVGGAVGGLFGGGGGGKK